MSGITPVEYKVVIKLDPVEETTESGIVIASKTTEREQMAQVKGELLAVGGNAFEDWNDPYPKPGDRVMIAKHAGYISKADDGEEYRVCNDKDIMAILS